MTAWISIGRCDMISDPRLVGQFQDLRFDFEVLNEITVSCTRHMVILDLND